MLPFTYHDGTGKYAGLSIDPPQGRPVGGGETSRLEGAGATAPTIMIPGRKLSYEPGFFKQNLS